MTLGVAISGPGRRGGRRCRDAAACRPAVRGHLRQGRHPPAGLPGDGGDFHRHPAGRRGAEWSGPSRPRLPPGPGPGAKVRVGHPARALRARRKSLAGRSVSAMPTGQPRGRACTAIRLNFSHMDFCTAARGGREASGRRARTGGIASEWAVIRPESARDDGQLPRTRLGTRFGGRRNLSKPSTLVDRAVKPSYDQDRFHGSLAGNSPCGR